MKRRDLALLAGAGLVAFAACTSTLNPQPLPPADPGHLFQDSGSSFAADANRATSADDAGAVPVPEDLADASDEAALADAGDAGDASPDGGDAEAGTSD